MRLLLAASLLNAAMVPTVWRIIRATNGWLRVPAAQPPGTWEAPRVSLIVPARNEERSIERCVRSLLTQEYPRDRVRVLVLDDRSTDRTGEILARLAAEDARLTVLTGAPLPGGWVGKCWALHQASRHADPGSRYLLFTDADTVHTPHMLTSVVRFAEARALDLLSLGTGQELGSWGERLFLPTILTFAVSGHGTVSEVNDPARRAVAKANGQFMLFRTTAYEAIGGHEAVKSEIVEDFALARLTKRLGHRLALADGRDLVRVRMYHSSREIWDGFSKNAFAEAQKGPGGALGALVALPFLALAPYALPLLSVRRLVRRGRLVDVLASVLGCTLAGTMIAFNATVVKQFGLARRQVAVQPLGWLFFWGVLLNSTWRTLSGRGVQWKGRTY